MADVSGPQENISWRRSARDQQVHAFALGQAAEPRSFLVAVCSHTARPAAVEPAGHRGHWQALLDPSTCLGCLVVVSDQLTEADQPGTGAR